LLQSQFDDVTAVKCKLPCSAFIVIFNALKVLQQAQAHCITIPDTPSAS